MDELRKKAKMDMLNEISKIAGDEMAGKKTKITVEKSDDGEQEEGEEYSSAGLIPLRGEEHEAEEAPEQEEEERMTMKEGDPELSKEEILAEIKKLVSMLV